MARTKKVVEENTEEVVVNANEEIVQSEVKKETSTDNTLKQENEALKNQLNEQAGQIAQLNQMLMQLLANQQQIVPQQKDDETILLGSSMYGREALCDALGNEMIVFNGFGDIKPISKDLFTSVYIPKNEKFFRSGLVYFVGESEKYYDIKKIRKPLIIPTEEELIRILNLDNVGMTAELDKITANKTNKLAMANLPNAISLILIDGKVNMNPMVTGAISAYFGLDINKTISMVMWATQSGICSNTSNEY